MEPQRERRASADDLRELRAEVRELRAVMDRVRDELAELRGGKKSADRALSVLLTLAGMLGGFGVWLIERLVKP